MEVTQLELFVLLAEHLHFRRAAALSGVSASTLSRRISDLEVEVGVRLFERNRRAVRLTPAGRVFLPDAQETLHRLRFAAMEARRVGAGAAERVRIGHGDAAAVEILQRALPQLRASHPDVRLQVTEAPSSRLAERLRVGELDLALLRAPVPAGVRSEALVSEELVAVVPTDSPLAQRRRVRAADLLEFTLVVPERTNSPGEHDAVMAALGASGSALAVAEEASSTASLLLMVGAGLGVGLVPQAAMRHADVAGVAVVPLATRAVVELWLAWPHDEPSPAVRDAIAAVRASVRESPDGGD
ncbi:MAG TPA: LysR substrate-binding domain-containing protein [Acidimicrobiales bacterium]|nr:LysR substrate-binding domain-containing protein [Acidimicrobiales bacterium]